jgi:hypothetical protein
VTKHKPDKSLAVSFRFSSISGRPSADRRIMVKQVIVKGTSGTESGMLDGIIIYVATIVRKAWNAAI